MLQRHLYLQGIALIVLYALLAAMADAATRVVSLKFAAPQLFFFSGLIGVALSYLSNRVGPGQGRLRPRAPGLLAIRACLFVASCVLYFHAFRTLVFVEVFAFVALVPVFAALLSAPVLGEPVRTLNWIAVLLGMAGMWVMYPDGLGSVSLGHASALLGALTGACSMVLARLISRYDDNTLLQVLYPNVAMSLVMGGALFFVYQPMNTTYLAVVLGYGVLLFLARWVLVMALARLPAYVATPLINIQFIFMLGLGIALFGEYPTPQIIFGAIVIILGGCLLVLNQLYSPKVRPGR